MAINISEKDWNIMLKAGATSDYMRDWVNQKRYEGWSDNDIQQKIDNKITTLSANPEYNSERGANWAGTLRAGFQGIPVIGSYADEIEAAIRSGSLGGEEYDKYLQNARGSVEGAFKNTPGRAYAANIGTGIVGEGILAALTGGASLHPLAQGAMGAVYGYGMGEGDWKNRAADAAIVGGASAALPVAGKYLVKGVEKVGMNALEKKIPNVMAALKKASSPKTGSTTSTLIKNSEGQIDVNILSTLMNSADDYPTQAKVATELVKETPKSKVLYNSEIMQSADELARIGWKNQVKNAVDDIAMRNSVSNADKQILGTISDKLSKATSTAIEAVEGAEDEVILKNVKEVVDYAIKQYGKGLSQETKDLLQKRLISEGMAKRVSNKLVTKSLSESAQKSIGKELLQEALAGGGIGYLFGPEVGLAAGVARSVLPGGSTGNILKSLTNKAADTVLDNTIGKATVKAAEKTLPRNMKTPINELSPRLYNTYNSLIEGIKNARLERSWKKLWMQKPTKKDVIDALKNPLIYMQPEVRDFSPMIKEEINRNM